MKKKNIVLIGMSGCGKSTIGKILSKRLGKKFIDIDEYIEDSCGKCINEIFKQGEEYFRQVEKDAVCKLSRENDAVISTGGGVVKNYSNIQLLKENGIIIFIDRPVENIAKDVNISNRPLLKQGTQKLYELFNERYHLYKEYSNFQIINNGELEQVIKEIIEVMV